MSTRLLRWLEERIDLQSLRGALLDRGVPDRLTWWHTLGSATLTVLLVQVVTGLVLATYYSPSPVSAYDSIRYIEDEVMAGSLLRGIHHWAASVMVVLVLAHLIRVFTMGAYKYPREVNWMLGVGLLGLVMGFGFTGYLLPWDQKAYWGTAVGTNMAGTAPVVGPYMLSLLRGGAELGAATLARFYAFHVLWLPVALALLVGLHLALVIHQGIASLPATLEAGSPARTSDPEYPAYYRDTYSMSKHGGKRFWPDVVAKDALVSFLVVLLIVGLAVFRGAALEPPADPTDTTYVPRPEWYFLPLYQLLKVFPGSLESVAAILVPGGLVLALLALPFFDRGSKRSLRHRPFALVSLTVLLGGSALLLGAATRGERATTPLGVVLTPSQRAGRALVSSQQCTLCHRINGEGGEIAPDLSDVGRRHSSGWMHSFIEEPSRFHRDTRMPAYGPPKLSHQEIEEVAQYLATLVGPQGLGAPTQFSDTFP